MNRRERPLGFWIITVWFVLSLVMLLMGQTMAVFNYDLAVQLGLQESADEVSEFGVQVNRALGAGDTLVYLPLMFVSLLGLWRRRRWALLTTAGVMGISAYWATGAFFVLIFLRGVPGYDFVPPLASWLLLLAYIVFGIWGLFYLTFRGENMVGSPIRRLK